MSARLNLKTTFMRKMQSYVIIIVTSIFIPIVCHLGKHIWVLSTNSRVKVCYTEEHCVTVNLLCV